MFFPSRKSIGFFMFAFVTIQPELANGSINKPILTCIAEHPAVCLVET